MTVEKTKYYGTRCCGKEGLWGHNIICTGLSDKKNSQNEHQKDDQKISEFAK